MADVGGEGGVVGAGGGGGGAADVEGDEAVLGAGEGVLVGVRMGMWSGYVRGGRWPRRRECR